MVAHRTVAQDAAKGLMIIAVIFFHCYLVTFEVPGDALNQFSLLNAFFPFLLSSFFFYAGYNYTPKDRTYKENVLRRAKQLLIPLVIAFAVSTISISIIELIFNHNDVGGTFQAIGNSILYSLMSEPLAIMSGFAATHPVVFELIVALGLLWFLYALFICSLFFYWLVKYTNKSLATLISVDVVLLLIAFALGQFVGVYLPYTYQCYPVIIAIMLTAAYLRQSHFLNRRVTSKKDSLMKGINMIVAEAIIVGTCIACYHLFGATLTGSLPGGKFDEKLRGFDAFIAFGFSILGTYFLHTLCRLIKYIPVVGKCLQWVGNHSAVFYLFHPIFIELAGVVIFQKRIIWGQGQAYFYVAVVVACLIGLSFLIDLLFKKRHNNVDVSEVIRNYEAPEDI